MPREVKKFLETFQASMRTMYPEGLNNPLQHRDVCRLYFMGYIDSLTHGVKEAKHAAVLLHYFEQIHVETWMPTKLWCWW